MGRHSHPFPAQRLLALAIMYNLHVLRGQPGCSTISPTSCMYCFLVRLSWRYPPSLRKSEVQSHTHWLQNPHGCLAPLSTTLTMKSSDSSPAILLTWVSSLPVFRNASTGMLGMLWSGDGVPFTWIANDLSPFKASCRENLPRTNRGSRGRSTKPEKSVIRTGIRAT